MGLFRRLIINAGSVYAGQFIESALQMAVVAFIVRQLSMDLYGAALLIISIDQMLDVIRGAIGKASLKYLAEYHARGLHDGMRELFASSVAIQAGLGVAGLLACLVAAGHVGTLLAIPAALEAQARVGMGVIGAGLLVTFALAPWQNLIMAHERYDLVAVAGIAGRLLRALLIVVLLPRSDLGLLCVVAAVVTGNVLQRVMCVALAVALRFHIAVDPRRVTLRWVKALSVYTFYDILHVIASILYLQGSLFIATHYISLEAVAGIGIVRNLTQLMDLAVTRITNILVPTMSRLDARGDTANVTRLLCSSTTLSVFVGGGLVVVLTPFLGSVFSLWLGGSFVWLTPVAILLLVGQYLASSVGMVYAALSGMGRQAVNGISSLACTLVGLGVGAWLVLGLSGGLTGLCLGLFTARLLLFVSFSHYGCRVFRLNYLRFLWHSFGKSYLVCLLVACAASWVPFTPKTWGDLLLGCGVTGLAFLLVGVVPVISKEDRQRFLNMLAAG